MATHQRSSQKNLRRLSSSLWKHRVQLETLHDPSGNWHIWLARPLLGTRKTEKAFEAIRRIEERAALGCSASADWLAETATTRAVIEDLNNRRPATDPTRPTPHMFELAHAGCVEDPKRVFGSLEEVREAVAAYAAQRAECYAKAFETHRPSVTRLSSEPQWKKDVKARLRAEERGFEMEPRQEAEPVPAAERVAVETVDASAYFADFWASIDAGLDAK